MGHFKKIAVPGAPCYPAVGEPRLAPRQELVDVWRPPRRHHGVRHTLYTATSPRNSWAYDCLTPLIPQRSRYDPSPNPPCKDKDGTGREKKKAQSQLRDARRQCSRRAQRERQSRRRAQRDARRHCTFGSLFPTRPARGALRIGTLCSSWISIEGGGKRLSWP